MPSTTTTPKLVIFTDLDGTMLDEGSYSFEQAVPALRLIREKNIPLVLSSSKTRAEIEFLRQKMENDHPFVSENGGAIFIPKDYFASQFPYNRETDRFFVRELGISYPQIVEVLNSIKKETGVLMKGFSDLTEKEISSFCGLDLGQAELAKKREYDEPFIVEGGEKEIEIVRRKIDEKGMSYAWGGRFHHILGRNDKGRAVEILKELYEKQFLAVLTVGIGDNLNDLPMLSAMDRAIFLKREDFAFPEALSPIQNCAIVDGAGPRAWNEVILNIVDPVSLEQEGNKTKGS